MKLPLLSVFTHDVGIDLGTANTLVYVRGHGIIINEPSVVAVDQRTRAILAIGEEAKRMVGRTPSHIVAVRPLTEGVVSNFEVTEQMLRYFLDKLHRGAFKPLHRPRVVIGIPYGVTEVERRAAEEAAQNAGAREVYLIEEPMAAAIGAGLEVQEAKGVMIVDIGGGTTEVAVISLGGIVASRSLRVAGDKLNQDIITYARERFNLLLGERTAEELKTSIGTATAGLPVEAVGRSVVPNYDVLSMPMRGRDLVTGLPKEIIVTSEHLSEAMQKSINVIVEQVKATVEETPPELIADIMDSGIVLAGGGALLRGLDQRIAEVTQMPVRIAEDPLTTVVRGTGLVLEDLDRLREVLLPRTLGRAEFS